MKQQGFIIFFTIFFTIYLSLSFYVFSKGWQTLPNILWLKIIYTFCFLFFTLSFIIGRFTENTSWFALTKILIWAGSFWFAAIVYFLMASIMVDIIRLANIYFHFLPFPGSIAYNNLKIITLLTTLFIVATLSLAGYINAVHPRIKQIEIEIAKKTTKNGQIKIAVISDIHLGILIGQNRLEKLVNTVNNQNPDIILLSGDILDEIQPPIFQKNIGKPLLNLRAPMGIFAITGNHEYIGGIELAAKYIETLNIKLLRDTIIKVNENIVLIGREDRDRIRFTGFQRKSLKDLLSGIDTSLATILLDHQPFNLQETVNYNIDFQISGHTHAGQIWPFNYIIKGIYELGWGYKLKGNTHFYVSKGYGTWGPPIRIGNKPEIAIITMKTFYK